MIAKKHIKLYALIRLVAI